MKAKQKDFLSGFLCACQFLALSHDQPGMAGDAMVDSGFSEADFLQEQKKSGYEDVKMNNAIKEAFRRDRLRISRINPQTP